MRQADLLAVELFVVYNMSVTTCSPAFKVACLTLQLTSILLLASDLHRVLHGLICKQ